MKLLILTNTDNDFQKVLQSTEADCTVMSYFEAIDADVSIYDAYCVIAEGNIIDARLRLRIEAENAKGKKVFAEAIGSYLDIYSAGSVKTTRSRLVYVAEDECDVIEGLESGDLIDDEANQMREPYCTLPGTVPILVYREKIIGHLKTDLSREEILKESKPGMWRIGENVMMTSFRLANFNKARFAPRKRWQNVISYICEWLTGSKPKKFPESVVNYGVKEEITDENFEYYRRNAVEQNLRWLEHNLVDNGKGGIRSGISHEIDPNGKISYLGGVRTDDCGSAAGVFRIYGKITGNEHYEQIASDIDSYVYGPMQIRGGMFDGMIRWSEDAWGVCYQDDVARAIMPALFACKFMKRKELYPNIRSALDFLVRTTAKDGLRNARLDRCGYVDEKSLLALAEAEHGLACAHYNAYYSAVLLLAYLCEGDEKYLETGRKGLETIMVHYPDTVREQSETEEMCRLILPLAILYEATGEEKHREMLYRVTRDLYGHHHPSGGYCEWDTGYKASCSRESNGECSILSNNGDPVADMLYSTNWLPLAFSYAYYVTKDEWFNELWKDVVKFCIRTQLVTDSIENNGIWCRAFDMDLGEAYASPHDVGWATYSSELGWTSCQILTGMMFPEFIEKTEKENK